MLAGLASSFIDVFAFYVFFLIALGTVLGVVVGAIPGLNGGMLIALTLPLTYGWPPLDAIALLVGMYVGSISGGLISATLLNIPGSPSNLMTTLDAMPMARRGEPVRALQLGIMASFFGGVVSWIALVLLSAPLAAFALQFGPHEYFAVIFSALVLIASLSEGAMVRGLISAILGLLVALPGLDPVTAQMRLTFGFDQMLGGFDLLAVLIGVFAVSQLLEDARPAKIAEIVHVKSTKMAVSLRSFLRHWVNLLRSSIIGTWVGMLPGVGGSIGSILAYGAAKSLSKKPEKFGTGCEEGVVASETANNATVGGAIIPMVTMGIPGSIIDVFLIAALTINNIRVGPMLLQNNPEVVYGFMSTLLVANVIMLIFMLLSLRFLARVMMVPKTYMIPIVLVFCVIGAFASNNRIFDVWVMLAFGLIGLLFRRLRLPVGPFVIALVLAPLAEFNLRAALISSEGDWLGFVTRPISGVFVAISIVLLIGPWLYPLLFGPKVKRVSDATLD
jgi:putative tricarboxylic transport membrane protein